MEVRAALNETLAQIRASENEQVKRLASIKRQHEKTFKTLSGDLTEAVTKSADKADRKFRIQGKKLESFESAILTGTKRSLAEADGKRNIPFERVECKNHRNASRIIRLA